MLLSTIKKILTVSYFNIIIAFILYILAFLFPYVQLGFFPWLERGEVLSLYLFPMGTGKISLIELFILGLLEFVLLSIIRFGFFIASVIFAALSIFLIKEIFKKSSYL